MNADNQKTEVKKRIDIKVERVYMGSRTPQELVIDLMKKRRESKGWFQV
ncbi:MULTISPECIES: hypothetical protein [Lacrimispora]|jgi:hypothetical protein|nr:MULTISPECIES: hypothetical protein [Lacrimispora]